MTSENGGMDREECVKGGEGRSTVPGRAGRGCLNRGNKPLRGAIEKKCSFQIILAGKEHTAKMELGEFFKP